MPPATSRHLPWRPAMTTADSQTYVARLPHRRPCDLCGEAIQVGQTCERWTYFPRGDPPSTIRVHAACQEEAKRNEWYTDPDGWPEEFPLIQQRREDKR